MDEDTGDEVKVFRRNEDADDDTIVAESSQLADDKKEAVLEAELETRQIIGDQKPSTPQNATPATFATLTSNPQLAGLPGAMAAAFSPSYAFPFMPWFMNQGFGIRPALSPNFFVPAALSPSFNMFNPTSPLYGAAAFAAKQMERAGPLNSLQLNQMRMPYMNQMMNQMNMKDEKKHHGGGKMKKMQEDHIKKPLNAFMWFMKENRKKLMEEMGNNEKQSAELNKELGKRWHDLSKEEQQKYFELAKKDREDHKQRYPQWSARENYAVHKKKKKKRDKSVEIGGESKKCRARFGVNNQEMWCKFCKRKKKCEYSSDRAGEPLSNDNGERGSSGPSPMTSSMGRSPMEASHTASDSESDVDDDDVDATFTQQLNEVAMQEAPLIGSLYGSTTMSPVKPALI